MNPYQWIWQYAKHSPGHIILGVILIFVNSAATVVVPLMGGLIIDQVITQGHTERLMPMLLIMIGVTLGRTLVRYTYQITFERIGQNTIFGVRRDLFSKLQSLDFGYFNTVRVGDIMTRMTGDIEAIRHFTCWVDYNVIECILWFLTAIIVMSWISWPLMLALVAITPLIAYLTTKMTKEAHPVYFKIREAFSALNSMVEENISGNRVVKAFTREDYEIQKFNGLNDDYKDRNMDSARVSRRYLPALDLMASMLSVIILLFGGALVIAGKMSLGDLVAFNGFVWMLNQPMRMSGWLINDIQRFSAATIKIRRMLGAKSAIPVVDSPTYERLNGTVTFDHVSFHYPDAPDVAVLEDISFTIKPGQTMGILGETGSGKTTLMNLIARFYDPTSGAVTLDDKDAREWPVRQLRDQITIVMQDQFLFSDTIRDNISYGRHNADPGMIRRMADIADADQFINEMPDGYDTIVGERGVGLSGGQKQRISLTRALVKDPSILILDDTTSALDMETEAEIQRKLAPITDSKTTFIIATRISSIRHADEILVLRHGRVIERGTHDQLLAMHGYYYDTFEKQLGALGVKGGDDDGQA